MKRFATFLAAIALVLPTLAGAHNIRHGDLEIIHPRAFETAPAAKAGGGYVTISNEGETDDALVAVAADFPKVMLHQSIEEDGVMRMRHVDRIALPAGEIVELAPGGYHLMFMGLTDPLEPGQEFPVTLTFEKAGDVEVMFKVEARTDNH